MVCKTTSIKRRARGVILPEWLVSVALSGFIFAAVVAISIFGARSFCTIENYVEMGQQSRVTRDRISKEIRGADKLLSYSTNQLIFLVGTNQVAFAYSPTPKTLARKLSG